VYDNLHREPCRNSFASGIYEPEDPLLVGSNSGISSPEVSFARASERTMRRGLRR
jgi:hypothetical protein